MKKNYWILVFILFIAIIAVKNPCSIPKETVYVDDNVSTPYQNGTQKMPYATIQEGIDNVKNGGVVIVNEGRYNENLVISGKNITLQCIGSVTISGESSKEKSPTILVENISSFNIIGCGITGGFRGIDIKNSSNIEVKENNIFNNTCAGIYLSNVNSGIISKNKIENTTESSEYVNGGIVAIGSSSLFILSNILNHNVQFGIFASSQQGINYSGIIIAEDDEIEISDNTITNTLPTSTNLNGNAIYANSISNIFISGNDLIGNSSSSIFISSFTDCYHKFSLKGDDEIEISDNTITNTFPSASGRGVGIQLMNIPSLNVLGNSIQSSFGSGIMADCIGSPMMPSNISNNEISQIPIGFAGSDSDFNSNNGGIVIGYDSYININNNYIHDNEGVGISVKDSFGNISKNTLLGNMQSGIELINSPSQVTSNEIYWTKEPNTTMNVKDVIGGIVAINSFPIDILNNILKNNFGVGITVYGLGFSSDGIKTVQDEQVNILGNTIANTIPDTSDLSAYSYDYYIGEGIYVVNVDQLNVGNNILDGNTGVGIFVSYMEYCSTPPINFENSYTKIYGNSITGTLPSEDQYGKYWGRGLEVQNVPVLSVNNNSISYNKESGISLFCAGVPEPKYFADIDNNIIKNTLPSSKPISMMKGTFQYEVPADGIAVVWSYANLTNNRVYGNSRSGFFFDNSQANVGLMKDGSGGENYIENNYYGIIVQNFYDDNKVIIGKNQYSGNSQDIYTTPYSEFPQPYPIPISSINFPTASFDEYSGINNGKLGSYPYKLITSDFNWDYKEDIILSNLEGDIFLVTSEFSNVTRPIGPTGPTGTTGTIGQTNIYNGGGTLSSPVRISNLPAKIIALIEGDFDNSGSYDFVAVTSDGKLYFYPNYKEFGFGTPQVSSFEVQLVLAEKGYFNEDYIYDIIAIDNQGYIQVLFGDGKGVFKPGQYRPIKGPETPTYLLPLYFDDSLYQSIAITSGSSNKIYIYNNFMGQSFGLNTTLDTRKWPIKVVYADINYDELGDLLVANRDSNNISILLGYFEGEGVSFKYAGEVTIKGSPQDFFLGDLNEDMLYDLAVVGSRIKGVSIFLGSYSGTFKYFGNFLTGQIFNLIKGGDFNNDYVTDLIIPDGSGINLLINKAQRQGTITRE